MRNLLVSLLFVLPVAAYAQDRLLPEADADPLMRAPVTHIRPGGGPPGPKVDNPLAKDAQAATRGMRDFNNLNCVGCHAANGGGGMGPALSNNQWIYGDTPAQIFLSIYQGRPKGMPAWGQTLPESTIWELVAYIQSISRAPGKTFGRTISRDPKSPDIQQVPAEFLSTADPWSATEEFTDGKAPKGQ